MTALPVTATIYTITKIIPMCVTTYTRGDLVQPYMRMSTLVSEVHSPLGFSYVNFIHILIYLYLNTCTYSYICMFVCMYVCMYACMHACMHACIYTYIHTYNNNTYIYL